MAPLSAPLHDGRAGWAGRTGRARAERPPSWPDGAAGERARRRVQAVLLRLSRLYGEPRVIDIRVEASGRLSASLARAYVERAEVRLALPMLDSLHLEEVLVHEVAHIVCFWRHGRTPPHGRLWRELMVEAGEVPRATLRPRDVVLPPRRRRRRRRGLGAAARRFLRSLL
jgi:predicted SprT family Zn-dependent metalloprotease